MVPQDQRVVIGGEVFMAVFNKILQRGSVTHVGFAHIVVYTPRSPCVAVVRVRPYDVTPGVVPVIARIAAVIVIASVPVHLYDYLDLAGYIGIRKPGKVEAVFHLVEVLKGRPFKVVIGIEPYHDRPPASHRRFINGPV